MDKHRNLRMNNALPGKFFNFLAFIAGLARREIDYIFTNPTYALLFVTYRCTNRCRMCTIWKRHDLHDISEELTLDEWKRTVDMIAASGVRNIELFGGDSLLRKDILFPVISFIRDNYSNIQIDLPTNSNLIDRHTADLLISSGITRLISKSCLA